MMKFPFVAVVGQESVKQALLMAMVNPKVGGVLVAGETGTAKSTIVRSLTTLLPESFLINLPLNATEDMIFGSLDVEYAVANGEKRFSPGLLARANEGILYIDDINLLRRELLNGVLDTAALGINLVEREGISYRHDAHYTIVGTMNPEEGTLSASILDRFGLYVAVSRELNVKSRAEIIQRTLAYEQNPTDFCEHYQAQSYECVQQVKKARLLVDKIEVSVAMMQLTAQLCAKACCAGHRAEIFLLEAAKAIAALADRDYLMPADIDAAAQFVLPHRIRQETPPPLPQSDSPSDNPEQNSDPNDEQQQDPESPSDQDDSQEQPFQVPPESETEEDQEKDESDDKPDDKEQQSESPNDGEAPEQTADIDQSFPHTKMVLDVPQDRQIRRGNGKRNLTRTDVRQGRYVRSCLPHGPLTDLAFDATVRAAAPYQRIRSVGPCCLTILPEDLRQKVREKRIGNTFLFVVDASGSMGARERMRAVKGAVFSMLQEAYQKRDQVGLIAFRRKTAELLLPITRSVDLAQKCLQRLPTGGKTPLAEGLYTAQTVLKSMQKKEKEMRPILVLVTDGRANSSKEEHSQAIEEAIVAARKIGLSGVNSVVIDTENDFIKFGVAQVIAREMGSTYYSLKELSDKKIIHIVKDLQAAF
jgi:magnesium chelatase subunit D